MFEFGRICEAGSSIIRTDSSLSFSTQGFFISRREGSPTAIAVPSLLLGNLRWQSSISEHVSYRFCTAVLLGKLGVVSVYLPDISKPVADFIACEYEPCV